MDGFAQPLAESLALAGVLGVFLFCAGISVITSICVATKVGWIKHDTTTVGGPR